jgi:hypothetical protein
MCSFFFFFLLINENISCIRDIDILSTKYNIGLLLSFNNIYHFYFIFKIKYIVDKFDTDNCDDTLKYINKIKTLYRTNIIFTLRYSL